MVENPIYLYKFSLSLFFQETHSKLCNSCWSLSLHSVSLMSKNKRKRNAKKNNKKYWNWAWFIGFGSLVVVIVAILLSGFNFKMSPISTSVVQPQEVISFHSFFIHSVFFSRCLQLGSYILSFFRLSIVQSIKKKHVVVGTFWETLMGFALLGMEGNCELLGSEFLNFMDVLLHLFMFVSYSSRKCFH